MSGKGKSMANSLAKNLLEQASLYPHGYKAMEMDASRAVDGFLNADTVNVDSTSGGWSVAARRTTKTDSLRGRSFNCSHNSFTNLGIVNSDGMRCFGSCAAGLDTHGKAVAASGTRMGSARKLTVPTGQYLR
jgi:hypothetical protein